MPLAGRPVLLMHGDLLCTRDTGYQAVRRQVRDPNWQTAFLAQPLQARIDFARQARDASRSHHDGLAASGQAETITDVDPATVADHLRLFDVDLLVHGHTHRPALHESTVEAAAGSAWCWATGTSRARCCDSTATARVWAPSRSPDPGAGRRTGPGFRPTPP